jgi:transcriptional regulator with XRE-family HTH domain
MPRQIPKTIKIIVREPSTRVHGKNKINVPGRNERNKRKMTDDLNTKNQEQAARLGAHVRHLRQAKGLSVRGLAAQAQVDATWLSRLEHGIYTSPDPRSLWRLAQALEIDVEELYLDAGYSDGRGLPGFGPYLRAKYDLPAEAISQLEAHFELISEKYHDNKGDPA